MAVPTTQVTGHETDIPGLIIFDVTSVGDERGWFQEKFHKAKLVEAGLPASFDVVQNSLAYNRLGVTRGFHAEAWDKYVSVVTGRIFVCYVDLREGESFGKSVSLEMDGNKAVYLPKGIGNSYQCITDDVHYLYSVNAHWSEEAYKTSVFVNLNDKSVGAKWPIPLDEAILSDRDRNHPALKDVTPIRSVNQ